MINDGEFASFNSFIENIIIKLRNNKKLDDYEIVFLISLLRQTNENKI